MLFPLIENGSALSVIIDTDCVPGIRRVLNSVSHDIHEVCGITPAIVDEPAKSSAQTVIITGIYGMSALLAELEKSGKLDFSALKEKKECYMMANVQLPFTGNTGIKRALVIAGSDKRGLIYGLFTLSEKAGVSPLVWIGDVNPPKQSSISIDISDSTLSKEPSVRYRGFFINDEWPAFGNWCMDHFGGVNAKAYEKIFELLLRLKGNYLWPAMWNSSFWQDGPGIENAQLADELGVIMGASHHEPMCRAGVEWQKQYTKFSGSNAWNFSTNEKGITAFWKEGLERSKNFENVITMGMRGENDSKLLSPDATMKDNIAVLKNAIKVQHDLIRSTVNPDLSKVPRMLAVYKEVEEFFFGDDGCEGLRNWDELADVLFLLADDNYGNLRALPPESHKGGYGMYYHFDYHGAPVSYEWQNSTRLTKVWAEMSRAWEEGVREMWIVNVGDLKGVEYPLNYFMDLAYDFEKWGSTNTQSPVEYAQRWISIQFGNRLTPDQKQSALDVLEGFSKWNALRRPEALSPEVYHPVHFNEGERIHAQISDLLSKAEDLLESIPSSCRNAYCSMIYYPASVSFNNILMNLEAGQNSSLAKLGCTSANGYASSIRKRIQLDADIIAEFHAFAGGKWKHMMNSAHTGFRSWDDHTWTYPVVQEVVPVPRGKVLVYFRGSPSFSLGAHWQGGGTLVNDDFTRPDTREVFFDIDSRGSVPFTFELENKKDWLSCSVCSGRHDPSMGEKTSILFSCDRTLIKNTSIVSIPVTFRFDNGDSTEVILEFHASGETDVKKGQYVEHQDYISMLPDGYIEKKDYNGMGWKAIENLGRNGTALLSYPVRHKKTDNAPWVRYEFIASQTAQYCLEFYISPRNPAVRGVSDVLEFKLNGGQKESLHTVAKDYYTEWHDKDWNTSVMNNIRILKTTVNLEKGENSLLVYAQSSAVILEKIVLYPAAKGLPASYLGPPESWRKK